MGRNADEGPLGLAVDACDEAGARLVERGGATEDPALEAHVASCLRCFRLAGDLRELPRIAAHLKEARRWDPGGGFWDRFPAAVADVWERSRPGVGSTSAGGAGGARVRLGAGVRIARVVQRPVAAALLGAAAALVLVAIGERLLTPEPPRSGAPAAPSAAEVRSGAARASKGAAPLHTGWWAEPGAAPLPLRGDRLGLDELEVSALEGLVDEMAEEISSASSSSDEEAAWRLNPAEELEQLDEAALEALVHGLSQTI